MPVVLYGSETWPLTLREEHRLRVFKNGVPRKIFEPKREEELYDLYSLKNIVQVIKSRRMCMGGACSMCGGEESCFRVYVGKPEGKSHLEDLGMDWRSILKWIFKK